MKILSIVVVSFLSVLAVSGCSSGSSGMNELSSSLASGAGMRVSHIASAEMNYHEEHGKFTDNIMNLDVVSEVKTAPGITLATSEDFQTVRVVLEDSGQAGEDTVNVRSTGILNAGDETMQTSTETWVDKAPKEDTQFYPIIIPVR